MDDLFSVVVVELIKGKWDKKISQLQQGHRYLEASGQIQHLFRKNNQGLLLSYGDFWDLPIVDVKSIKKTDFLEWGGVSCFEGSDGEEWKVELYNSLGQSSTGCTEYLAAIFGMVPCIMCLKEGGEDQLADHHSVRSML